MKGRVYAVPGVVADHAIAEALGIAFDHPADHVDLASRFHCVDCASQCFLCPLGEQPGLLVDLAAEKRRTGVSVYPMDIGGDVDLDDVTILEGTGVGDAVADDLIDRSAAGLREPAIAKR